MDTQLPDDQAEAPKRFSRNPSPLAQCIIASEGNINAGILLHQILYRFRYKDTLTKRYGKRWIAQTSENWNQETALTLDRYKSAKAQLKELKLIEIEVHKYKKHHKWGMTFIRPLGEVMKIGNSGKTPTGNGVNPATVSGGNTSTNKDSTEGENKKEKDLPSAKKSTFSKDKKDNEEKSFEDVMLTIPTAKEIEENWCNNVMMYHPNLAATSFAGSDFNSAKILIAKLGPDADLIIEIVVLSWKSFVNFIEDHSQYYKLGDIPDIHVLAKHAGLAIDWWFELSGQPHTPTELAILKNKEFQTKLKQ